MASSRLQCLLACALLATASASEQPIAGYEPGSDVTSHNLLDLDQQAIEGHLKVDDFAKAQAIYQNGANSGARATLTVSPLTAPLSKGQQAVQGTVKGLVYANYGSGATSVKVSYDAIAAPTCIDNSAAPNYATTTCFKSTADVIVAGTTNIGKPTAVANTYRTLAGFSTGVEAKFNQMSSARQVVFNKFKNYYSTGSYANDYVLSAFDGSGVWSGQNNKARKEGIKKGIVFMNVWMYTIREFEDAIHDCKQACSKCNMDAVHAWDEGVAFYTGSLEGVNVHGKQGGSCTGSDSTGCMLHMLADKRCVNFNTCDGNDNAGPSTVNKKLFEQLALGNADLLALKCDDAVRKLNVVVPQMTVPLIQGALRYAWKIAKEQGGPKEKAEGAVFSAAVLPLVHACNTGVASLISDNMKIGANAPMAAGFAAIKTAFEQTYTCLGITCAEVGGLLISTSSGDYFEGAAPCGSSIDNGVASAAVAPELSGGLSAVVAFFVYSAFA